MSHIINLDTIHLLISSTHANLHETNLSIYKTTIAIIVIFKFVFHSKAVFQLFDKLNSEF